MDDQNKNLILAIALSMMVILIWPFIFPYAEPPVPPDPAAVSSDPVASTPPAGAVGTATLGPTPEVTRETAIAKAERISVQTPRLQGSISLTGGRIDDLRLSDYRVSIEQDSEIVTLLSPAGSPHAYYSLHGWAPAGDLPPEAVPNAATEWSSDNTALTPDSPVSMTWDNGEGLIFTKTIAVDENYLFTVTQTVANATGDAIGIFPYGVIARHGRPPDLRNFFVLHEGMIQSVDGETPRLGYGGIEDLEYNQLERAATETTKVEANGWIGFTDHYWMTLLIPNPDTPFTAVTKHNQVSDIYQTEIRLNQVDVAPGEIYSSESHFFAGAKEYEALADYQADLGVQALVDSIDWGWFYFLTKPIFIALHFFKGLFGNMGVAIIMLTLVIKTLLLPLAYKSYVSMSRMKMLQPEMEKVKERVGDDRMAMQKEMMELYKREKVNPAAGCLPILLQIPIFFSLYKVIFVTLDLRHAPFFGWLTDLSAPDPSSILNLFGLLPFSPPDPSSILFIFSLGVLPILMGITMWLQQKLNPAPTDPTQAMIFAYMPWIFMFMLGTFASGLVLYWTINNVITFAQQYLIMRSQGAKPDIFGNIRSSFKRQPPPKAD